MHAPTETYWAAVKRIMRYLKGTSSFGLHLTRDSSFSLHGFTDADWAGGVLMIENLLVDILSFLVRPLFYENLGSNALLLVPLLN